MPNPSENWLLRAKADLTPAIIAKAIAKRLKKLGVGADIVARMDSRLAIIAARERQLAEMKTDTGERAPWFCSGCPHNTSTRVPEGSRAVAGIGCHYMAVWMDRSTSTFTQMGGEGVPWVGQAPFTNEKHIFANLGDGTYFHSGLLAIRQSIAAGVNITYKMLYNDAVAMTGGQQVGERPEGHSVLQIMKSLVSEGVKKLVIVTDEPEKYEGVALEPGVTVHHRDELDRIQRELRELPGTTAIIYDQTCATEKRRRRKRGKLVTPDKRVVINEAGVRRLRRLLGAEQLPVRGAGGNRVRPQAAHQPEHLQQGLFLRQGLLPELRHRRRRAAEEAEEGTARRPVRAAAAARAHAAAGREGLGHRRRRRRRHRRHHHRPAAGHGRAPGRQGRGHAGRRRPGAEGRRHLEPRPDRQPGRGDPHHQGRHRHRPTW